MQNKCSTRLKTAIVGCGKVAGTHALAYRALPNSEFVAACDVSPERAEAFGAKFQVRGYTDLEEMLSREKVDVLSVCTQHTQHPAAVEAAAAAGVHVISEKPLAIDLVSCDRAIAAAVYLHSLSGEIAARHQTEQTVIATDLLRYLPEAIRGITNIPNPL